MELAGFFKSVIDADNAPVVICDTAHTIIYMNPCAVKRYEKRGGAALIGRSLLDCHNEDSREKILRVAEWFAESPANNRVYEFYSEKENSDVYMIALRGESGELIGYYEKHEHRDRETAGFYEMKG